MEESKKIIEKLLKNVALKKRDFDFLKKNPEKFKNIKFIQKGRDGE